MKSSPSPSFVRNLTLTASLTGLNVVARIALAGGPPNVKPVAFLAIIAGVIGGPLMGLIVGVFSMFISDFYFGGGVWTIIDSASMGIIGFLAGLLWNRRVKITRVELAMGGFFLTAVYDVATSVSLGWIFGYSWWAALLSLNGPYPFGLVHEFTTAALMGTVGPALIRRARVLLNQNKSA